MRSLTVSAAPNAWVVGSSVLSRARLAPAIRAAQVPHTTPEDVANVPVRASRRFDRAGSEPGGVRRGRDCLTEYHASFVPEPAYDLAGRFLSRQCARLAGPSLHALDVAHFPGFCTHQGGEGALDGIGRRRRCCRGRGCERVGICDRASWAPAEGPRHRGVLRQGGRKRIGPRRMGLSFWAAQERAADLRSARTEASAAATPLPSAMPPVATTGIRT